MDVHFSRRTLCDIRSYFQTLSYYAPTLRWYAFATKPRDASFLNWVLWDFESFDLCCSGILSIHQEFSLWSLLVVAGILEHSPDCLWFIWHSIFAHQWCFWDSRILCQLFLWSHLPGAPDFGSSLAFPSISLDCLYITFEYSPNARDAYWTLVLMSASCPSDLNSRNNIHCKVLYCASCYKLATRLCAHKT